MEPTPPSLPITPRLPTLIFLNGPSGVGKTTLAEHVIANSPYDVTQHHHATPLWAMMDCITSSEPLNEDDIWKDYSSQTVKDSPVPFAGPRIPDKVPTYRDALISLGHWTRETFGPWALSRIAVDATRDYLSSQFTTVIFPACRTVEDIELLSAVAGTRNCLLIRLFRDGHSFANDLGGHIPANSFNIPTVDLHNSGTPDDLFRSFYAIFENR